MHLCNKVTEKTHSLSGFDDSAAPRTFVFVIILVEVVGSRTSRSSINYLGLVSFGLSILYLGVSDQSYKTSESRLHLGTPFGW